MILPTDYVMIDVRNLRATAECRCILGDATATSARDIVMMYIDIYVASQHPKEWFLHVW